MKLEPLNSKRRAGALLQWVLGVCCLFGVWNLGSGASSATAASLTVQINHTYNRQPLRFDEIAYTNAAGNRLSVSRLSYLLSGFTLHRAGGDAVKLPGQFAFLDAVAGRCEFVLTNVPSGDYRALEFNIGLDKETNHADPAGYGPKHPLNPLLNGLHWSWQGGYVFLALEGHWESKISDSKYFKSTNSNHPAPGSQTPGAIPPASGYSFHLATDAQLMRSAVPLSLQVNDDACLGLILNVADIFAAPHRIALTEEASSTHSRTDDVLAVQLRENVERAFRSRGGIAPATLSASLPPRSVKPLVATNATPYRFSFARHFPPPDLPRDNPLTEEGVALGKRLFNDPLLSVNGKQSCASCHQVEAGFVDAGRQFSLGAEGQSGTRNAMPLFNLAWKNSFFWDGRAPSLRQQVLMPIENPVEMHESLENLVKKLAKSSVDAAAAAASYPVLFARAFGGVEITSDRVARALEQFLLTLVSYDSKFDRVMQGREQPTEQEKRGFELFHTEYDPRRGQFGADCFHCHGGPLFQNVAFANNGLDSELQDLGRYLVTGRAGDKGRFAVPSLRNVALTAPYMHDGRFASLDEVVEHYSTGVRRSSTLDPNIAKHPGGGVPLSAGDKAALVAFLKMLTDETLRFEPQGGAARQLQASRVSK
jgi:cytochrome c peroxidase